MFLKFHQISCRVIYPTRGIAGGQGSEKAIKKTDRLQKDSAVLSLPKTFENSIHCIKGKAMLEGEKSVDDGPVNKGLITKHKAN